MNEFRTIAPDELNTLAQQGKQVHLIDVRSPAEYRASHVSGAISIPIDNLSADKIRDRFGDSSAGDEQPLFLTCHSGLRAQLAAERLKRAGFENVYLLEGGTEAWMNTGLPMQKCGNAISLERQVQIAIGALLVLKVIFGFTVNQLFFAAIPIIGAGLIVAGITRWCGMAQLMAMMPWNRGTDCSNKVAA